MGRPLDRAAFSFLDNGFAMSAVISPKFDEALEKQNWNLSPQSEMVFPTSTNPMLNAATAIAICAYPQSEKLRWNGKAHKYQQALLAYSFRVAQWTGLLDQLPPWVRDLKAERMWDRLRTGHRNLMRSFVVRDLIYSAVLTKSQSDRAKNAELSTFTLQFSPDLRKMQFEMPIKETEDGVQLCGKIPQDNWSSLRKAIKEHASALSEFMGPSPRIEGPDEEYFYQNTLTRFVKPTLQTAHILQVVWEAATRFQDEAMERRLPIDQILMRKAEWAKDIHIRAAAGEGMVIFETRELGIPSCSCKLVHLGPPPPDS